MRKHTLSALLLTLVLFAIGCKSDQERSAESLEAFAEAVVIHRAPYHAYALLDGDDKEHISVEAYVSGFEEREAVFRPFYRLDVARNMDDSGTGLGLAIARDIARSHGGDIVLDTSPLGGLRVILTIPT